MSKALTFIGEIELIDEIEPDKDFGDFKPLPNIKSIQELAREFSEQIELMPYQQVGGSVKLIVSVYLEPKNIDGRVIAVLMREDYPNDLRTLKQLIERAIKRVELLSSITHRLEETSIATARNSLSQLYLKIADQ